MKHPRICAVITTPEGAASPEVWAGADLVEIRIDMIGKGWENTVRALKKPWIATNRLKTEGGLWTGTEEARRVALLKALSMGAAIIDIELAAPDLEEIVPLVKKKARCMISHHDMKRTPPRSELRRIINDELAAGADICKLVTTARAFDDNAVVLGIINEFKPADVIAFCMGPKGQVSRILSPLSGSAFSYAAVNEGETSASGQLTISQMKAIFGVLNP